MKESMLCSVQTEHDVGGPAKSHLTCLSSVPLWLQ